MREETRLEYGEKVVVILFCNFFAVVEVWSLGVGIGKIRNRRGMRGRRRSERKEAAC